MRKIPGEIFCQIMTVVFFFIIAGASYKGQLMNDLSLYNTDKVIFFVLLAIGFLLTNKLWREAKNNYLLESTIYSAIYFFIIFVIFSDGHVAGWGHSQDDMMDKVLKGILTAFIYVISVFVPLMLLVIGFIYSLIFKVVWYASQS